MRFDYEFYTKGYDEESIRKDMRRAISKGKSAKIHNHKYGEKCTTSCKIYPNEDPNRERYL